MATYGYVEANPLIYMDLLGLYNVYHNPANNSYSDRSSPIHNLCKKWNGSRFVPCDEDAEDESDCDEGEGGNNKSNKKKQKKTKEKSDVLSNERFWRKAFLAAELADLHNRIDADQHCARALDSVFTASMMSSIQASDTYKMWGNKLLKTAVKRISFVGTLADVALLGRCAAEKVY